MKKKFSAQFERKIEVPSFGYKYSEYFLIFN